MKALEDFVELDDLLLELGNEFPGVLHQFEMAEYHEAFLDLVPVKKHNVFGDDFLALEFLDPLVNGRYGKIQLQGKLLRGLLAIGLEELEQFFIGGI